jgi:hypothetical protein
MTKFEIMRDPQHTDIVEADGFIVTPEGDLLVQGPIHIDEIPSRGTIFRARPNGWRWIKRLEEENNK